MNVEQVYPLPEAATLCGLSVKTLRKRAKSEADLAATEGRQPQAYLQHHKGGQRWVVTQALLDTLQAGAGSPQGSPVGSPQDSAQVVALRDEVAQLKAALQVATVKAEAQELLATERAARLYDLQQSLLALTSAVRAITEGEKTKRRWWQRKTPPEVPQQTG